MDTNKPIELAKNYVALSNAHNLTHIQHLFDSNATYHSAYFGEYKGSSAILTMMTAFFARFPDAHWEVMEYREIEDNSVEFAFVMTGIDTSSGEQVKRQGLERIYFTPDGLIKHLSVSNTSM